MLRLIGEQYLVTLPQLAYLADRSERTARWLRTRWQRAGLVNAEMPLVEEPTIVWLTRRGLACVDLPWKEVRPSYHTVGTAAALLELRLAAAAEYPSAVWVSRRALSHRRPLEPPLPDALLQTATASVAVVAKLRSLDRHELEERVAPIVYRHEHTLLVLPNLGERVLEWADEQAGRVTAIGYSRDPRAVRPPVLPHVGSLEHAPADGYGAAREKLPDGVQFRGSGKHSLRRHAATTQQADAAVHGHSTIAHENEASSGERTFAQAKRLS